MKLSSKLAVASLSVNALLILSFAGKKVLDSHLHFIKGNDKVNELRCNVFEQALSIDSTSIVFAGTSITEGFPVTEMFQSLNVKNRGIYGNETYHLIQRIDKIMEAHPRKIFLEIGVNDFSVSHLSADSVFANYRVILEKITSISPRTVPIVQLLFPTSMTYSYCLPGINSLNEKLKQYCNQRHIAVVDLYTPFCKNGQLDSTLTYDGIHLNARAYRLWKEKINTLVVSNTLARL